MDAEERMTRLEQQLGRIEQMMDLLESRVHCVEEACDIFETLKKRMQEIDAIYEGRFRADLDPDATKGKIQ